MTNAGPVTNPPGVTNLTNPPATVANSPAMAKSAPLAPAVASLP